MYSRNYFYVAIFLSLVGSLVASAAGSRTKGNVAASAEEAVPLKVGEKLPAVKVMTEAGETVKITKALEDQASVIVFYRGHWCPYCMKHLTALQEIAGELGEMGVKLVAVTPDKPEYITEAKEKAKLSFDIYSDGELALAKAMGVAFQLDSKTAERYKKHLVESTGHDTGQLPVPAVFLTDKAGGITYVFSKPDYKVRLSNEELLAEVEKAMQ